jgi:N-acetylglucosamine kinase-like BadF-type ATPase
MRVVIGADVGGTKIAITVAALDGTVRRETAYPAEGWEAAPIDAAARWLLGHLTRAVPEGDEIAAVGIGAQGCDTQEHCVRLAAAIEAVGPAAATVVNDAALLIPAAGLESGIGVIAGTGSIGVGTDRTGAFVSCGGWGWVLGDEAGAPAIVREATKSALAAFDDGRADDGLLSALLEHFAVPEPQALARAVNDEATPENWGPAAPVVFRAADEGSALAAGVIDDAARSLELLVSRLVRRGAVGTTVVAAGSVIVNQPRLADGFRAYLARAQPGLELRLLDVPPVAGAVALARRRAEGQGM